MRALTPSAHLCSVNAPGLEALSEAELDPAVIWGIDGRQ
jgi:hypothetical protein